MSTTKGTQILTLTGLRFDANLGILAQEKVAPQPIQVDAELNLGTQDLLPSDDDILHVLDYRKVRQIIITECTAEHVNLLESLIGKLAHRLMQLPGGADFQLIVNDRLSELDARYVLETDGGDLIYVQNRAIRSGPPELIARLVRGEAVDPAQIYFRCSPSFETASASLAWMAERMFVGTGARYPDAVAMRFFELC